MFVSTPLKKPHDPCCSLNERLSNRSVHGDGLSSTQLVTDDTGAQAARIVYGAWGEQLSVNDSVPGGLDVRFVGGLGVRNDSASGLIYMRHRWYDAQLGRFISRDPISFKSGRANLYEYCENRPSDLVDKQGLKCGDPPAGDDQCRDPFATPDLKKKYEPLGPPKGMTPSTGNSSPGFPPDASFSSPSPNMWEDNDVVFYPPMIAWGIIGGLFFRSNVAGTRKELCRQLFNACIATCYNPLNMLGHVCTPLTASEMTLCQASCIATKIRCIGGAWPWSGVRLVPRP